MAEAVIQSPPPLSKDYLLPREEKPVQSKSVEVTKEEAPPVTAASEDIAAKTTGEALITPASEESGEVPAAPAVESHEAPASTTETSTEEAVPAGESVEETAPVAEESSEVPEQEESAVEEETPDVKLVTAPADFRFPTTNQTRHCFTRYIEYHRCVAAKGDDAPECDKFAKFYRSLCPGEWVDRWNEQRENGTFAGPL